MVESEILCQEPGKFSKLGFLCRIQAIAKIAFILLFMYNKKVVYVFIIAPGKIYFIHLT